VKPELKIYLSRRVFGEDRGGDKVVLRDGNQGRHLTERVATAAAPLKMGQSTSTWGRSARKNALKDLTSSSEVPCRGQVEHLRLRPRSVVVYLHVLTNNGNNS
jgi:hypothetical protein